MFRLDYNAPFTLTFSLLAIGAFCLSQIFQGFISAFCTLYPEFIWNQPVSWLRPFSYVLGHANTGHLFGNVSFLLLLGPALEERYGTRNLLLMSLATTLITAIVFILFFKQAILGASGVVFMFIVLSSFTKVKAGHIPLTFVLVLILFLGKEILDSFRNDQISQTAHLIGGIVGSFFGLNRLHGK